MGREVALLDDILLQAAAGGKSGDEIERLTGVPAAQAVMHIKQLLASRDIWTEFERRQLLLRELNELKDSLRNAALDAHDADSARLMLKTLETIGRRLDAEQKQIDVDAVKVTEHQARIMGRAFEIALEFMKKELAEKYPDITLTELDQLASAGLIKAKYDLAAEKHD
jgi:pantothenate synthetase